MFHLLWWSFPRSGHLQHYSDPKAICRCQNVSLCSILWLSLGPIVHRFMEGEPVVDKFTGRTMTNLQLMCHFINSHPSVLQDHVTDSFRVYICNGRWWASGSFLMLNACATILEPLDPFVDHPLRHDTVPILHWYPSMHCGIWYTFSP